MGEQQARCGNRQYLEDVAVEEIKRIIAGTRGQIGLLATSLADSPTLNQVEQIIGECPGDLVTAGRPFRYCMLALGDSCPVSGEVDAFRGPQPPPIDTRGHNL